MLFEVGNSLLYLIISIKEERKIILANQYNSDTKILSVKVMILVVVRQY